jgi:hypothetical protein
MKRESNRLSQKEKNDLSQIKGATGTAGLVLLPLFFLGRKKSGRLP